MNIVLFLIQAKEFNKTCMFESGIYTFLLSIISQALISTKPFIPLSIRCIKTANIYKRIKLLFIT